MKITYYIISDVNLFVSFIFVISYLTGGMNITFNTDTSRAIKAINKQDVKDCVKLRIDE